VPALSAPRWIRDYYAALDERDLETAMTYFAPEASMKSNHNDPVVGSEAIAAQFKGMFDLFSRVDHELLSFWEPEPDVYVFEMNVTWERPGREPVVLPGAAVCRGSGERWVEQVVYADLAPAFAE